MVSRLTVDPLVTDSKGRRIYINPDEMNYSVQSTPRQSRPVQTNGLTWVVVNLAVGEWMRVHIDIIDVDQARALDL